MRLAMEVLILGMHRSGTSLVSGIINKLGIFGGEEEALGRSGEWNPKGYWEFRKLTQANNRILALLGKRWDRVAGIDDALFIQHGQKIASICEGLAPAFAKFAEQGDWAIKDPRMCLLLPAWRDYFRSPLAVLVVRDPVEVAISLNKRNQMPLTVGVALWEAYMRSALRHSQGMPRILVDYNALLQEPGHKIQTLHGKLAEHGVEVSAMTEEIIGFVDSALYRSRNRDLDSKALLNGRQAELYERLREESLEPGIETVSVGGIEALELYGKAFPEISGWERKWLHLSKYLRRDQE